MKSRTFPYLASLLVALIMVYALWQFDRKRQQNFQDKTRFETLQEVGALSNRLNQGLYWRTGVTRTLGIYVSLTPNISEDEFKALVADLLKRQRDVVFSWVALIRDERILHYYPIRTEEKLKGMPLENLPELARTAEEAISAQDLRVTEPLNLAEGPEVVAMLPIFEQEADRTKQGTLLGLTAVKLMLKPMLRQAGLMSQEAPLEVAIRESHPSSDDPPVVLFGDDLIFGDSPIIAELTVDSQTKWELAAIPVGGWPRSAPGTLRYWLAGLALTMAMSFLAFFIARIPWQLARSVEIATAALRVSEERFRSLFEATFEAVMVHDQGRILDVNHAFELMFGYELSEIVGQAGQEFVVVPGHRELVRQKMALRDPRPYELRMVRKDGSQFDAEVVGKDHVYRGRAVRVVAIRDITERKKAEAKLRQRLEFEALVNTISTHFINLSPSAITSGIEQALATLGKHTGSDSSYLVQFPEQPQHDALFFEWNASGTEAPFGGLQQFASNAPWLIGELKSNQTVRVAHLAELPSEASGERELFEARGTCSFVCLPVRSEGRTIGLLGFESRRPEMDWPEERTEEFRVVSEMFAGALERKRAEEALRQTMANLDSANRLLQQYSANLKTMVEERTAELELERQKALQASRAKSDFLSTMSHELRTPLNSILGLAQVVLMKVGASLPDQQKENLQAIIASGRRLLDLINRLLDLSRIEAGKIDMRITQFPVDAPLVEAFESVRPLAERKGLKYYLRNEAPGGQMRSDTDKLVQILINLLGNAVKFTDHGEIELAVAEENGGVCFSVRDTGIGISPDEQEIIFQRFRQVDSSSTRRHGGSGLGLSISRHLAQLLGGTLTLESTKGIGSTFRLWLPRSVGSVVPALKIEV